MNSIKELEIENKIKLVQSQIDIIDEAVNIDYKSMYKRTPIKNLGLTMGSDEIPRFCCANHKLNLSVRGAISIHEHLNETLKALNKSNSHIRRSIQLNNAFKDQKCKLRLENLTRWSSAYLMLLSVKKAYDKNMFNDQNPCPVDLDTVKTYLKILQPALILSTQFQYNHSSIVDVIPSVKQLIYRLQQMD